MVNSTRVASQLKRNVPRREYTNPPVFEVILDLQFQRSLDEKTLRELRGHLAPSFPQADQQNLIQMVMQVGPAGQAFQDTASQFGGWLFRDQGWVLQTSPMALTLHSVRQGPWPTGAYVGWSVIYEKFLGLHTSLAGVYGSLGPKRAGVRYLNRIAIPKGEDISRWLGFTLRAPSLLQELYTFNLRQTWARAGDSDDISATVGLAKIDIEDPTIAANHQGILLDIDVFNLWIPKAPSYAELPDWLRRAHEVENQIFEGCITDRLRERFDAQ